jgi:hypothetical protein
MSGFQDERRREKLERFLVVIASVLGEAAAVTDLGASAA